MSTAPPVRPAPSAPRVEIAAQRFREPIQFDECVQTELAVGVVVPFDFSLDWEYWRYLPPGVALHFTRTPHLRRDDCSYLARSVGRPSVVGRTARTLLAVNPAATLYACTSGSFIGGVEGEAALRTAMAEAGCANPVTSSGAAVEALRLANLGGTALSVAGVLITLPSLALFAVFMIGYVAWHTRQLIEAQVAENVAGEVRFLSEQYRQGGIQRLVFVIDRRARRPGQLRGAGVAGRGALAGGPAGRRRG